MERQVQSLASRGAVVAERMGPERRGDLMEGSIRGCWKVPRQARGLAKVVASAVLGRVPDAENVSPR